MGGRITQANRACRPQAGPARAILPELCAAIAGALLVLATGCAATDPTPAPSGLPEGVTVAVTQLRSDVADRQAQVQVRNDSDAAVMIGAVRVDDPRFTGPATRVVDRTSTLAPGATVNVRVQLATVDCTVPDEAAATVTIDYAVGAQMGSGTAAAPEVFPFLAALHRRECVALHAADAAEISFGRFTPSAAGAPAVLELQLKPGIGGGDLTLVDVRETNLLTFTGAARGAFPVGAVVTPISSPQSVDLPLLPARCDPHAVQEDKRGTVFTLDVEIDGEPGQFTLAADPDLKAQILRWVTSWCGYG